MVGRRLLDDDPTPRLLTQTHEQGDTTMLSYVIELKTPAHSRAYVVTQAETRDDARALIEAQLSCDDAVEDVVIIAVHLLQ